MKLGYFVLFFILFSAVCGETASTEEKINETKCLRSNEHSTCSCPFQTKPLNTFSFWNAEKDIREFSQTCEPLNLPFNESTCKIYPINDEEKTEYEYLCPNNGFLQTWGAFAPRTGSYSIRLWFRCCEVECPKWNCMWSPYTEAEKEFIIPLKDVYAGGARGRYVHENKDSVWSIKVCQCDLSSDPHIEL